ncbi:MAG: Gldg family protein [Kiritimatiellae bacterium]|nr:Gldg family protein [Kiritimatiellia bacterium]
MCKCKSCNIKTVFGREFKSYFDSPVAYVFLVAFLVLAGFLTFGVAMLYERRQADLTPFFFWHPWVYLLLVPAATMGSWAEERRNGTIELLLTLPVTLTQALVGKFLAAWAFIGIGLALTFPVVATTAWLGSPDWGAVFCGYLGSFLLAGAATAIGVFASSLSRSQVIGFVAALAITFAMLLIGFDPVVNAVANWGVPSAVVNAVASCSLMSHFESLRRGVIDFADIGYYVAVMVFMLAAAHAVTDGQKNGGQKGALGLVLLAAVLGAANLILASMSLRIDLTAEGLYTLSKGSKAVLGKLDENVTLKFYFSSSSAETPMAIKTYANQVQSLLKEYELAGNGNIVLEAYDPKPDSDAEDWAQRYGIEPQNVTPFGQPVYFGLVAVCGDREETLAHLSQRTESTLEYDVTRLVTRVAWPERPVLGLMTSLQGVMGQQPNQMMMMQGQRPQPGWAAFTELSKDYEVREISPTAESIDSDVKALVILHAKDLSEKTLFAIDQFVIKGGRLIACVDPFSVMDMLSSRQQQNPMMMQMGGQDGPSTLGKLFDAWGVSFDTSKLVADLAAATKLGAGNGRAEENPAFLSLTSGNMDDGDIVVSGLTQVMLPFSGALSFAKTDGLEFEPLMTTSSDSACMIDRMGAQFGMGAMMKDLRPDGVKRTLAARLSGTFKTAFPKGPDWKEGSTNAVPEVVASGKGAVVIFADSDFLADNFCVQTMNTIFGPIAQPINDNLVLFSNIIEQYAGREELIGVRSRGPSNRPFVKVNELEAKAMAKWQRKQSELEAALQETQQRLSALQKQKSGNDRMILSREQQEEIAQFRKVQADTRRQLKNVRKELTADIDSLGLMLKVLNILAIPALVIFFGIFRGLKRRKH